MHNLKSGKLNSSQKKNVAKQRTGDCSYSGVIKQFKDLGYMTKGVSITSNPTLDKIIKSRVARKVEQVAEKYVKNPALKSGIKMIKNAPSGGAYAARVKNL